MKTADKIPSSVLKTHAKDVGQNSSFVRKPETDVYIQTFIYSVIMGLTLRSVPPTIISRGGTVLTLGITMSASKLCQQISQMYFGELLRFKKTKQLLIASSVAFLFMNSALIFPDNYWGLIINRLFCVLLVQFPMLCGRLYVHSESEDLSIHNKKLEILGLIGSVSGALIVGHIYDLNHGFYYIIVITSVLNIFLCLQTLNVVDTEKKILQQPGKQFVLVTALKKTAETFQNIRPRWNNLDLILIKSMITITSITLYIKFVLLLIFVFRGKSLMINYTSAYQAVILFVAKYIYINFKDDFKNETAKITIINSLLIALFFFMISLAFASSHLWYLLFFIPVGLAKTFLDHFIFETFKDKLEEKTEKELENVGILIEIIVPIFIGLLFDIVKENAYRILTIVPVALIFLLINLRKERYQIVKQTISKDRNIKND